MLGDIPDYSNELKKKSSWLDIFLVKIFVGILSGPTVLWISREEMMSETSKN